MNEKHPEPEPSELFTLFAYTSKHIRAGYYKLIDYTNKEFRATRTEALAKATAYFDAIESKYKSVTLFAQTFKAGKGKEFGKIIQTPIFTQGTI
jgi:hypothetical protein